MRMVELIDIKKRGATLSDDQIAWMIRQYTGGAIPDYQMAAMAMAICLRGMTDRETAALTFAMAHSGDTVDLSEFGSRSVDKHSTGGVGDKTTLIVGPIVAALGGKVAKMSGRGLGFTGGTIDKLESIPGYRTALTPAEFRGQVARIGIAVVSQSGDLAPADKKLYALRDVTDTVDSIPLIASSVMSKKLAAGAHSIVLDVKSGSGAFMKTPEQAAALAKTMVAIGQRCGRQMTALITNMDAPLGQTVGNALEVREAAQILQGGGDPTLRAVCRALAIEMHRLSAQVDETQAAADVDRVWQNGEAFARMEAWIAAQSGDARVLTHPALLPQAPVVREITADTDGYLCAMQAQAVGEAAGLLGTGRMRTGDSVDPAAGIELFVHPGDHCRRGDLLARLHTAQPDALPAAEARFRSALRFGEAPPRAVAPVLHIIRKAR